MLIPLPANQWDRAKAAHLLNRAAFGGPPEQIDALAQGGMPNALASLIDPPATAAPGNAPEWARPRDLLALRNALVAAPDRKSQARAERHTQEMHLLDLGLWWVNRMRDAQDPFQEKMTLFWHGHFATSAQKVKDAYLMWRQNQTFREQARGNFGVLTKAMSRDPAMIAWLDLRESRASHANENFARELMELFTLGEGHYSERDVTEGARAFTGYRIDPRDQSFRFAAREHDFGPKQFLAHSGNFHGDQIIDLILEQPACAQHLAQKLWTFFAYENAEPALIDALAQSIRASRYEMRPVLRQLFASAEFYSPRAIGTQVKSPVQFLVGAARTLGVDLPPGLATLSALKSLGQTPFAPPSVKGWDGGKAWISTSTLLMRYNLAGSFVTGFPARRRNPLAPTAETMMANPPPDAAAAAPAPSSRKIDLAVLAPPEVRSDPAALVHKLAGRLFESPLSPRDEATFLDYLRAAGPAITDKSVQGVLHLMMSTPRFQLC